MPVTSDTNPEVNSMVAANNGFGFRLLALLAGQAPHRNIFISSFSVATALAMLYNGAEGRSKAAMAEALGIRELTLRQLNAANAAFAARQKRLDPKIELAIANSIWTRQGIVPSPEFIERITTDYDGQVASLDFGQADAAEIINRWVYEKTHRKIRDLVTPPMVSPAILILINAIYFKGIWTDQFDPDQTVERDFHLLDGSRKRLPMMFQSGTYGYYETGEFQAVSLPYGEGRVRMYIFLPRPPYSITDFQQALNFETWQAWLAGFSQMKGDLGLPRFKVEYKTELLPALTALGGPELAGEDFRGLGAGPLIISNVIHKTFLEVNEEGTEAAAATAVVVTRNAIAFDSFRLVVDRPFFCAIRDNDTGAILFMGFILDPT